ncbi:MAG: GTPase Era [Bacteroidetes bacterium RIFOXYA12_FULL_35_11]|nr:MAG: GTPase Era [Bacteroidetes bacterium GWF2_35_48]OFY78101.1 MAG: GTPase Era [Bacteroidetes bacterium RIFOXYA12_FULL_35_11]OFY99175.1 MAG: GTPase Era [Bacteroidetes bacterium RIFOXYC12_FULL_35_7]HBX53717.1 GTPase Era [Bacteroidales bacterium]
MAHKAGFVNIIGNPNAGKSTLMNALVGDKLSIITSKAQTTRHRILGILNGEDFQVVFSDTPGIITPRYKLQESMMRFVGIALTDADILLYVADVTDKIQVDENISTKILNAKVPLIIALNKIDLIDKEILLTYKNEYKALFPDSEIFEISALNGKNIPSLMKRILALLPESEPYYPKDELTDKPERFFVSEIIREKILLCYRNEIPYCSEVVIEEFKEDDKIIRIRAIIHVARDSQKGIIIGHQGKALKKVGITARKDIEKFFGKQVYLETFVKVTKDWRDSDKFLKHFGYSQ